MLLAEAAEAQADVRLGQGFTKPDLGFGLQFKRDEGHQAAAAGISITLGGRVENQARATRSLLIAIGVALFAVFVLLYGALGSIVEAGLILSTVPMALVGGVVALFIARESWNVSSLVGLIGLFGIAVQNSLVLITQTRT